jgi:uncharacterized protein YkwD
MAKRDFFDHVTPEGKTALARAIAGKFPCRRNYLDGSATIGVSENIFQNNLYRRVIHSPDGKITYDWNSLDEIAKSTVKGWMESPGHRANILTPRFDTSGVGIAISAGDQVLITQMFC